MKISRCGAVVVCAYAMILPVAVFAQTAAPSYPVKPVRVIVPFPPGSGVDLVTRIVVPRLAESELFRREAKIEITHVPYKGSNPALIDLLGGHVDMFFCNMLSATPYVSNGKLRALAVTSLKRSPAAPQVPTVAESGFPNFETVTWFGMMAPAAVPEYVVAKLHPEVAKVLRRADVQKDLASQGASATFDNGPDEFAAYLKSQTEKLTKVVKILGVQVP